MAKIQKNNAGQFLKKSVTGPLHFLQTAGKVSCIPRVGDVLISQTGILIEIMQLPVRVTVKEPAEIPAVFFVHTDDEVIGVIIAAAYPPGPVT